MFSNSCTFSSAAFSISLNLLVNCSNEFLLVLKASHDSKWLGKSTMDPVQEQPPPSCLTHFTRQPLQTRYMKVPFLRCLIWFVLQDVRQFGHDGVTSSACWMQSLQNKCSQGVSFGFSGMSKHMEHFSSFGISSGLRGGGDCIMPHNSILRVRSVFMRKVPIKNYLDAV